MMRVRLVVAVAALHLSLCNPVQAFTTSDTIADWLHAATEDRLRIASILVLTAGQGHSEQDGNFFVRCIDEVANDSSASDRRIREVAAGCTYMAQLPLADAE